MSFTEQPEYEQAFRARVAHDLFVRAWEHFETFREHDIGAKLAYLMGAILTDDVSRHREKSVFIEWLKTKYSESHLIWKYVEYGVSKEAPANESVVKGSWLKFTELP